MALVAIIRSYRKELFLAFFSFPFIVAVNLLLYYSVEIFDSKIYHTPLVGHICKVLHPRYYVWFPIGTVALKILISWAIVFKFRASSGHWYKEWLPVFLIAIIAFDALQLITYILYKLKLVNFFKYFFSSYSLYAAAIRSFFPGILLPAAALAFSIIAGRPLLSEFSSVELKRAFALCLISFLAGVDFFLIWIQVKRELLTPLYNKKASPKKGF